MYYRLTLLGLHAPASAIKCACQKIQPSEQKGGEQDREKNFSYLPQSSLKVYLSPVTYLLIIQSYQTCIFQCTIFCGSPEKQNEICSFTAANKFSENLLNTREKKKRRYIFNQYKMKSFTNPTQGGCNAIIFFNIDMTSISILFFKNQLNPL